MGQAPSSASRRAADDPVEEGIAIGHGKIDRRPTAATSSFGPDDDDDDDGLSFCTGGCLPAPPRGCLAHLFFYRRNNRCHPSAFVDHSAEPAIAGGIAGIAAEPEGDTVVDAGAPSVENGQDCDRRSRGSRPAFFGQDQFEKILTGGSGMEDDGDPIPVRQMSQKTMVKLQIWRRRNRWLQVLRSLLITPEVAWLKSFCRSDPRQQIFTFFNEVAREGGEVKMETEGSPAEEEGTPCSLLLNMFGKGQAFTVWRPCSNEAIKNMMMGIATGKGLDIKGKSAKKGNISSYVPFIQIYEDSHKEECRSLLRYGSVIRVFYQNAIARFMARKALLEMKQGMDDNVNLCIDFVDTFHYSPPIWGLDIAEHLFWEAYVINQDCSRPAKTEWDIGRKSVPPFMGMNLKAVRQMPAPGKPRAVVYQMDESSPLEPRMLLMAYEQHSRVKPVVSDFDCFLLGTRGVKYKEPIPRDQIELLKWMVNNIGEVLDERAMSNSPKKDWTETWFEVRGKAIKEGVEPKMPPVGYGDWKSCEIAEVAVSRLQSTGCVRHGAECFNWSFPQEIDDKLLVISDSLPGKVKWKEVNASELQDLLVSRIEDGFTFPLNPKWILCDPGWRRVYDALLASHKPNVQDSINCWLPPGTGLREQINALLSRHPSGFGGASDVAALGINRASEGRMYLMQDRLEDMKLDMKWEKSLAASPVLKQVWYCIRFVKMLRQENEGKLIDKFRTTMVQQRSWRASDITVKKSQKRDAWKRTLELLLRTRHQAWRSSFCRLDPRQQILKFFKEVAREEVDVEKDLVSSPLIKPDQNMFTVWRPTEDEAIKNMILGIATGRGLNIKGKRAKRGNISSFVPFIQIYKESHKKDCQAFLKSGMVVRVYYQSFFSREEAFDFMMAVKKSKEGGSMSGEPAHHRLATGHLRIDFVNTYVHSNPPLFGLDITEDLFWESYVIHQDCSRPAGTEWDIGRRSEPAFMHMNFKSIRRHPLNVPTPGAPRAVVYQMDKGSPLEPRTLLMAYEQYPYVKPVVADFDCFLLGSRGFKFNDQISQDQMELQKWMVTNIGEVLDGRAMPNSSRTDWMDTWFKVLKKAIEEGYEPKTPTYGYGDPKSCAITEHAVSRLQSTGCVRHGAECFNWFFPQEMDKELLVISDTLPGNVKWKKMPVRELQDFLVTKIDEGFTFPLNPKWVLCDPGWKRVYDALLASQKPFVQDSINCWLPPRMGLRGQIEVISSRHPSGFEVTNKKTKNNKRMNLMRYDLKNLKTQLRWRKIRLFLFWIRFLKTKRQEKRMSVRDSFLFDLQEGGRFVSTG